MLRQLLHLLSPAGEGARLSVLIFHRVRAERDPLFPRATDAPMVREAGLDAALPTAWGVASRASDPFQLSRFTPWDRTPWRFGVRLAQNLRRTAYATA
jgi:hypothetical protein